MARECLLLLLVILSVPIFLSAADDGGNPPPCPTSFTCKNLGREIHFPFTNTTYPECGFLIMGCEGEVTVQLGSEGEIHYKIIDVDQVGEYNSFSVHFPDLQDLLFSCNCTALDYFVPLPAVPSPMLSFWINNIATLRICNNSHADDPYRFSCKGEGDDVHYSGRYYGLPEYDKFNSPLIYEYEPGCSTIQLPFKLDASPHTNSPFTFLTADIHISVTLSPECHKCYYESGGQCITDPNNPDKFFCGNEKKKHMPRAAIIALAIGCSAALFCLLITIILLYKRRRITSNFQRLSRNVYADRSANPDPQSSTVFFGIPVFSYTELEEATNNFDSARELGDGGFGTVYYGILRDGREVAVKRLYEHNYRRVEQFLNEIAILTRLRHRNLVSFYGCTSRHSRELLLVYEYIPNGTVACHLYGDLPKPRQMPWPLRMKIAIEIASALAYLHASDVIHRDVKTNNILLDNSFCVKVADFGLSRLFPNDVTHISTAPQGTPGYVDPEYRQCYQLTNKSDVYSFGVVLIELISSLPAVDTDRQRDEINLANLAIKRIQNCEIIELVDPSLGFGKDKKVKRMIESVAELALHCLQLAKEDRPSMDEVLDELKRIESGKEKNVTNNLEESDVRVDGISIHIDGVSKRYVHPPKPHITV